jgi:type VI secretion system protein ImpJ
MTQLQPVLWSRGVLLAPQHLQAHDRFLDASLQFTLSALASSRWGFTNLDVDAAAVAAGEFRVRSAAGVFPDGLLFDIPDADAAPPPRPIANVWREDQSTLLIYLAVPEYKEGRRNVDNVAKDSEARFVSDFILRRDENSGEAERRVEIARKNIRLLTANESHEGYSALAIARILRKRNGVLELDSRYVPPLLDFRASPFLAGIAQELVERLSARSSELSEIRRQRNQGLADFGNMAAPAFWLLYTLNSHLPIFRHLLETRGGHPSRLFEAMLALAGSLTTFSSDVTPQSLATYDHSDSSPSFIALRRDLIRLLDTVLPSGSVTFALEPRDDRGVRVHVVTFGDDRYLASDQLFIAIDADLKEKDLLDRASALKIAAFDDVRELVQQSQPGLSVTHVPSPPVEVRVKPKFQYFRLAQRGDLWSRVRRSRSLAVHAPSGLEDATFELVVVNATQP